MSAAATTSASPATSKLARCIVSAGPDELKVAGRDRVGERRRRHSAAADGGDRAAMRKAIQAAAAAQATRRTPKPTTLL